MQKYDADIEWGVKAVRNDCARWKKQCKDAEKESNISNADKNELKKWRLSSIWIEAHAHPKTLSWLNHLWTNRLPKAKPQPY